MRTKRRTKAPEIHPVFDLNEAFDFMHSTSIDRPIRRACIAAALGVALIAAAATPLRAHEGEPFSCASLGTPEATVAAPESTPEKGDLELDLAYFTFQDILAEASIDLATLASRNLERPEIADFAAEQVEQAEADLATLEAWQEDLYPGVTADPFALLPLIDAVKMQLDLPAGLGGTSTAGLVPGIVELCTEEGPFDVLYLASAIDLAQQQIDLAQVAVIESGNPEIVEFATGVIERETAAIGQLVTWQNELAATPAG
jgi:uncharacterized protein (DUF305 family)